MTYDPLFHARFDSDTAPLEMDLPVSEENGPWNVHMDLDADETYTVVIPAGDVQALRRSLR
jgi:hypothetical protein